MLRLLPVFSTFCDSGSGTAYAEEEGKVIARGMRNEPSSFQVRRISQPTKCGHVIDPSLGLGDHSIKILSVAWMDVR